MKYRHIDSTRNFEYLQVDIIFYQFLSYFAGMGNLMNDLMSLNFIFNKFYATYVVQKFHELTFE